MSTAFAPPVPSSSDDTPGRRMIRFTGLLLAATAGVSSLPTPPMGTQSLPEALQTQYRAGNQLWGQPLTGAVEAITRTNAERITELKERSGLTWEQIARLFGVSKRAVLHWRGGANMAAAHEEALTEVLAAIRDAPTTDGTVKDWLMTLDHTTGRAPYQDLLAAGVTSEVPWIDRQPQPRG